MPADLHCRTWASTSSWDTNGLNDGPTLESGFYARKSHTFRKQLSWKRDGSWRIRPFWGVVEKSNFLICQKSTTAVTLLLTTWQQQQHHQTANYIMYTEKPATGLRLTPPFLPLPAKLMKNPAASAAGGLVLAKTQSLLHCRIGVKSSIVLCI